MRHSRGLRRLAAAIAASISAVLPGIAFSAEAAPPVDNPWRQMFDLDVAGVRSALQARYIYAHLPGGTEWSASLDKAMAIAARDRKLIRNEAGYRAVLAEVVDSFGDPHLRVRFDSSPTSYRWPGLLVRRQGGAYRVVLSQRDDVRVGEVVTACAGEPVESWESGFASRRGLPADIDATRGIAAAQLMLDDGSPFAAKPPRCVIGGRDVALTWTAIPGDRLAVVSAPFQPLRGEGNSLRYFGASSAWVRFDTFQIFDIVRAREFRALIGEAAKLRHADVVVFDVRGNNGGDYNWFMTFLRAFYGQAYADHFARARLEITPVFVTRTLLEHGGDAGSSDDPAAEPPDPPLDATFAGLHSMQSPQGDELWALPSGASLSPVSADPPERLVKARVYVLTDTSCASSCIAFVDEMRRIPGVVQVGLETYVDRRSGTPIPGRLPSGAGTLDVPNMVRLGRPRGENEPVRPQVRWDGNINDTAALEQWILQLAEGTTP
jgi:hypothetical protein